MRSPLTDAYHDARSRRLFSVVYFALNQGVPAEDREDFRERWNERGTYFLGEHLLRCASSEWERYPETFWVDPWIARQLQEHEAGNLCYILEQWLANEPLPAGVSTDPAVEDEKVKKLEKLRVALNP